MCSLKVGATYLIFVDVGVKINDAYHREVFLSQKLVPVMCEIYGEFFIFQQGNVPAHRAGETTFWDERHLHSLHQCFAPPPYSTDLNSIEYKIWGKCIGESAKFMTSLN